MKREEEPHRYCHACGSLYMDVASWPRTCHRCTAVSWGNPKPCVILLIPVLIDRGEDGSSRPNDGLLTIVRKIPPHIGGRALPGGYIDHGESWQRAAARELREETGIIERPERFKMRRIVSLPDPEENFLLLFCSAPPRWMDTLDLAFESEETRDLAVMASDPQPLVFSTHREAARSWFRDDGRLAH